MHLLARPVLRIRRLWSIRLWSIQLVVLASVAVLFSAPAWSQTDCVWTSLRGDIGAPGRIVALVDARADFDDLRFTLERLGAENKDLQANLLVLDEDRQIVDEQNVVVGPEPKEFVLPGVLAQTAQQGLQLWLRLEDGETSEPYFDVPLRVGVDCPLEGACSWTLDRDVATDGPLADQILMDVLRDLQSAGLDDPLGVMWDEAPELRGSVAELALRWQRQGQGPGQGQGQGQGFDQGLDKAAAPACRCKWVAVKRQAPLDESGDVVGTIPFHRHESWRGASGYWAAQMVEGSEQVTFPRRDLLVGFELVCGLQQGVRMEFLEIASQTLPVRIPVLGLCQATCEAEVQHDVTMNLCASVRAFGHEWSSAFGLARLEGRAWVADYSVLGGTAKADVLSTSQSGDVQASRSSPGISTKIPGNTSYSRVEIDGGADLRIESSGYVYASVASRPELYLQATASCAETPMRSLYVGDGNIYGGGTVLERWGDPP